VISLSERHGFAYYGDWARVIFGWTLAHEGRAGEGVETIEAAIASLDRQHALARRPYYLSLLADACLRAGRPDRARTAIESGIEIARKNSDLWWLSVLLGQQHGEPIGRTLPRTLHERADL
jgi:hypothetical protein